MSSKIKNILIFLGIALVLVLIYFLVFKKSPEQPSLVSSNGTPAVANVVEDKTSSISKDFLAVLLNVKSIKIDDAIFSDPVFLSLEDSSIELIPDGNEGRPNPFAPLGTDIANSNNSNTLNSGIEIIPGSTLSNTIAPTLPVDLPATNTSLPINQTGSGKTGN